MTEIKILNGNLDEDEEGKTILRGVVDQATLKYINIGWYQREQGFSHKHTQEIVDAFLAGISVPDITIGMRGHRVSTSAKNDTYILRDKCYAIDGGQRLWAAGLAVDTRSDLKIRLGAKIYFGTTEETENEMFCKLGTTQKKIASQVLLRNRKKKSEGARILVELNKQDGFALKERIAWDQNKTHHELITGYSFAKIVGALHSHKTPLQSNDVYELLAGFDKLIEIIGETDLRGNVVRFFEVIDQCWTIRNQSGARGVPRPHLSQKFLLVMARLMSNYPTFWDGDDRNYFNFPPSYIRRLKGFKLHDFVKAHQGVDNKILYELLRKALKLNPITEADPFGDDDAQEAAE